MLASAPYALLFWISRVICPTALHASVYLKANKDFNNEFSEDGKILKVGRSPEVSWRLPHLASLTAFFSRGGNICPTCFETGDARICTLPHGSARHWSIEVYYQCYFLYLDFHLVSLFKINSNACIFIFFLFV